MSEFKTFSAELLLGVGDGRYGLTVAAEVFADGDHLVIRPLAGNDGLFRIPAGAVRIGNTPLGLEDAPQDYRWLEIDPAAPCMKMTASRAGELLAPAALATLAVKRASITLAANGEGTLIYAGKDCPCLGRPNLAYEKDLTVKGVVGLDKFPVQHSNEFDVDMLWAVLIMGQRGIYIHEGAPTLAENGGPSAGCIHLGESHAKGFYDWIEGPTRIVITYPW